MFAHSIVQPQNSTAPNLTLDNVSKKAAAVLPKQANDSVIDNKEAIPNQANDAKLNNQIEKPLGLHSNET